MATSIELTDSLVETLAALSFIDDAGAIRLLAKTKQLELLVSLATKTDYTSSVTLQQYRTHAIPTALGLCQQLQTSLATDTYLQQMLRTHLQDMALSVALAVARLSDTGTTETGDAGTGQGAISWNCGTLEDALWCQRFACPTDTDTCIACYADRVAGGNRGIERIVERQQAHLNFVNTRCEKLTDAGTALRSCCNGTKQIMVQQYYCELRASIIDPNECSVCSTKVQVVVP